MKHIGLFAGIGGFELAARWIGWKTLAWCEWNEFGQKILKYHFPEAEGFGDITKTDFKKYANKIDVLTGGFPCQPYSAAGKRLGTEDDRHLWPEMLRAIREIQPGYVVGENVRGLTNWNGGLVFDEVQADLENEGYEVLPFLLPACGINAPHRRDRIWFIAYSVSARARCKSREVSNEGGITCAGRSTSIRQAHRAACASGINSTGSDGVTTNPDNTGTYNRGRVNRNGKKKNKGWQGQPQFESGQNGSYGATVNTISTGVQQYKAGIICDGNGNCESEVQRQSNIAGWIGEASEIPDWRKFPTQPPLCSGDDGLPSELDGLTFSKWRNESLKAYGNAIVPQLAYQIYMAINQIELQLHQ